jgi:hypothetical protein
MTLSTEAQALFDHARNSIPRWVTTGKTAALEWLYGFGEIFEAIHDLATEYLEGIFLSTAAGRWLDQHARDRDTTRRDGESDDVLRERLRQVEDAITDPALQAGINAILGVSITTGGGTITFLDAANADQKVLTLAAGTYTLADLTSRIRNALPAGWTFQFINGKARFNATDAETGDNTPFDVTFTGTLGSDFNLSTTTNWDVEEYGYYESDSFITYVCGITHLRREGAYMHSAGTLNLDSLLVSPSDQGFEIYLEDDGVGAGSWDDTNPVFTYHYQPGVTTIANFESTLATFAVTAAIDLAVSRASLHPSNTLHANDAYLVHGLVTSINSTPISVGHYWLTPTHTAFMNGQFANNYRMTNHARPMTYVALLPDSATLPTKEAVEEYLRQFGPGGYEALVERYF